jgi:hypothetical protein
MQDPQREIWRGDMWDIDDQRGNAAYAAELGDDWTEVEPGIFVRVEAELRLQVVWEAPEPHQPAKGAA